MNSRGRSRQLACAIIVACLTGCSSSPVRPAPTVVEPPAAPQPSPPPPPSAALAVTTLLAFGDSLTEGVTSLEAPPFALVSAQSYPYKLQTKLAERYVAQSITVFNEGRGGERAEEGVGRLSGVLQSRSPEVVLLMEGVNDLVAGPGAVQPTLAFVGRMVNDCRSRGAQVLLATLPPQRRGGVRAGTVDLLPAFNSGLGDLAKTMGVTLVDLHEGFAGDLTLIGADGLHPTEAGYERIAQIFFAAITAKFEKK